jgi:small subunit ribosomal protein S16
MLKIRFQRIGRRNDPAFRIVALEHQSGPKAGKYVELLGTYNPKTKATSIDGEKIEAWVKKGAQVSPSVHNLLVKNGLREGSKIAVIPQKTLVKHIAKREEEAKAAAEKEAAAKAKADAEAKAAEDAAKEATDAAASEAAAAPSETEAPAPAEETPAAEAPADAETKVEAAA